jgi:hypothetical protein
MLNSDSFKILKIPDLKFFCKGKLKNYSKFNKVELFNFYNRYLAAKVIQRLYRKHFYENKIDCITLEPVSYPCFIYRTKTGKIFCYSFDSIIKNIMKTGDTREPMTRTPFTDTDLNRLDLQVKQFFPETRWSSTLKIKNNLAYAKRIRNRENEILSYNARMDEIKTIILNFITEGLIYWDIGEIIIENVTYRSIRHYLKIVSFELKLAYLHLKELDSFSASIFKQDLLEKLDPHENIEWFKEIILKF